MGVTIDEFNSSGLSIYDFFKDKGNADSISGSNIIHEYDYYNVYDHPCAWFVECVLRVMGLLEGYVFQCGTFRKSQGYVSDYQNKKGKGYKDSAFTRACEYFEVYRLWYIDRYFKYNNGQLIDISDP